MSLCEDNKFFVCFTCSLIIEQFVDVIKIIINFIKLKFKLVFVYAAYFFHIKNLSITENTNFFHESRLYYMRLPAMVLIMKYQHIDDFPIYYDFPLRCLKIHIVTSRVASNTQQCTGNYYDYYLKRFINSFLLNLLFFIYYYFLMCVRRPWMS